MNQVDITLKVNGEVHALRVAPNRRLLDVLREDLGLTGTKEGCSVGECGACTVALNGEAINACLVLAAQADGADVLTVEGLAVRGALSPLQQAFLDEGAVQCGYCIPGMLVSAHALLSKNPNPSTDEIKLAIAGNICRCTGYAQPVAAIRKAADAQGRDRDEAP